jgi:hypothetical protein
VLQGMHKDENYIEAKKFLHNQPDVFINDQGKAQRVFTVQGGEFYDPLKYSQYNADPAYRDFMWTSAGINYAPPANASAQEKAIYEQRESERLAQDFKRALPGLIPGVMAVGTGVVLSRTPAVKSATGSKPESAPVATTVSADKTAAAGKVGTNSGITFNEGIANHLTKSDGFSQKTGISGAHNLNEFKQAAAQNNVKIISQTPSATNGIIQVEYQIPKLDAAKNVVLDRTGSVVYRDQVFIKTVYDPSVISDNAIVNMGRQAATNGYGSAISSGAQAFNSEAGGILFRVYIDPKTGSITN